MYYKIHHSHTKNNLISYIIDLHINIKYNYLSKDEILNLLDSFMQEVDLNYTFIPNQYSIKTNRDLIKYLELMRPNKNPPVNIKDHKLYINLAKKILCYCSNGCHIERTPYNEEGGQEQLLAEARLLGLSACHIPTCRRAIRNLNEQLGPNEKIDVVLSPELMNSINSSSLLRLYSKPIYTVKRGKFIIDFT
jgi:hypothetical protein